MADKARAAAVGSLMPDRMQPLEAGPTMQLGAPLGEVAGPSNSVFMELSKRRPSIDQVAASLPDSKLICQMLYTFGQLTLDEGQRTIWTSKFGKYCG